MEEKNSTKKNQSLKKVKEPTREELAIQIKKQLHGVFQIGRKAIAEDREQIIAILKVEEEVHKALDKLIK